MTNRYEELINAFEEKLRKLIARYQLLEEQNMLLKADLVRKQDDLMHAHQQILELRKRNEHLSIAKGFEGSEVERIQTKNKINKMVREIDKCIALLDE